MNAPDLTRPTPIATNPAVAASEPPAMTLGDVIEIVRRHRTAAILTGGTLAALVLALGLTRTPLYEANATIALDRGRRAVDFDPRSQFDPYTGNYEHDLLNTQRTIIQSRTVLENALKAGGLLLNEHYVAAGDPIERLKERLFVTTSRESWDLTLSLRDENPQRAEAALQGVLDSYLAQQVGLEKKRADTAISFLEIQQGEAQRKMEQAREVQQNFQRDKNLFALDPDKSYPAQRLTALNAKKVVLSQQIAALQLLVNQIEAIDALPDAERRLDGMLALELVGRHPLVIDQQKLLYELRTRESQFAEKYLDRHPRMIEVRSEIATKREHLGKAVASVRAGVMTDHAKMAAQLPTLTAAIREVEEELNAYRENLFRLQTMAQHTRSEEQIYEQLLKRLNEERVTRRLDAQQVSVIDQPHASSQPVNQRTSLTLAFALVAGAFGAVLTPLAMELLSRRTSGSQDIRTITGWPVLSELPYAPELRYLGAHGNPDDARGLGEAFRALRTALGLRPREGEGGRCVVVTSCDQSEGKSTVSTRLAVSMAQSGLRVLLVDGDLRQPALREHLAQASELGLSELLSGVPGIAPAASTYPNLDFLDAGALSDRPGELLNSHCLPEWLAQCRTQYDYVIIDTPPMRWFADPLVIAAHADDVLLVVRDGTTLKSSLAKVHAQIAPLAHKVLGMVLIARPDALATLGFYGIEQYRERRGGSSSHKPAVAAQPQEQA